MARQRYRLTLALQEKIAAFIRAGGFAHVAAEAAGLPREVFARWLERGERAGAPANYRAFARAIREAEAQARLQAELKVRGDKPLDWLKAGPGKANADNPGWSNPGKAGSTAAADKTRSCPGVGRGDAPVWPLRRATRRLSRRPRRPVRLARFAAAGRRKIIGKWHDLARFDVSTSS